MGGKILIIDDVATNRIVLKVKLAEAGYLPVLAADGQSGLAMARRAAPDLILVDQMLPDLPGTAVLARLRADPVLRAVPVVMLSAATDPGARTAALRAGADDFLAKPVDDQILLARIRGLLRARAALDGFAAPDGGFARIGFGQIGLGQIGLGQIGLAEAPARLCPPGLIALVMNRPEAALQLRRETAAHLPDRMQAMTGDEALAAALSPGPLPDVFLIETDYRGAGGGLRLMSELRSRSHSRHAAFCLISAATAGATPAAVAYDLGAGDIVPETVPRDELALRLPRRMARKREADDLRAAVQDGLRLAMIDPLTGLHNRRYGLAKLAAIAEAARVAARPYAVMVVDLDRFKSVNDRWGHAAGDAVLVETAARLAANLRAGDLLARVGGEEFLIALPETGLAQARAIAERLCQAIQENPIPLADRGALHITVSIGLAISPDTPCRDPRAGVSDIVNRADLALLRSKSAGRNQVTIGQTAA